MSDIWRICVVEGDVSLNQNLVNSLCEDGYVVQGVMNSADAKRILESEEYQVVIYDQNLSDGFEFLHWLRFYRSYVRLIALGNASETGEGDQCLQALASGAISYIQKPVDLRLLKDELHRLLRQTGFTASLDSFDLLDVIQIITMGGKSITLLIDTGPEGCGMLRFQNGSLVWAEYGVLRGEEAFFALAAHKNGTVTQQPSDELFTPNVTQPLPRLIFQALQYRMEYAHERQSLEEGVVGVDLAPVQSPENALPPAQFLPDGIDDSPFVFTSEGMVSNDSVSTQHMPQVTSNDSVSTQHMPQVAPAEPAFSVPQEPLPPTVQFESPVIGQLDFAQSNQYGYPPSPSTQDNAANPYTTRLATQNRHAKRSIIIGSVVTFIFLVLAIGTYAIGTKTVAERPTPTVVAQAYQKNIVTPISSPTPTPTPISTPTPTVFPQPTQPVQPSPSPVGVNGNPWGYNFNPGNLIYSPPENFCDYFNCVRNFWDTTDGYVDECKDGTYSHSGGTSNACFKHGGEMRPLYSH